MPDGQTPLHSAPGFGDGRSPSRPRARAVPRGQLATSIGAALRKIRSAVLRRRWERQTYRALSELHDHVLKDIGLSRSDLMFTAREAAAEMDEMRRARETYS